MMEEDILSAIEEEEDHMTGYETIIIPSPRNSRHFDLGTPLGAPHGPSKNRGHSIIVNSAARSQHADTRRNTWNTNPRSGIIIQHLNSIPPDETPPRIVEVTGMEDQEDGDRRGITNPDYPRSETGRGGQSDEYPTLPVGEGPPLPDRDYNSNSDSRPDIQRIDLSAGDGGDPIGQTVIPSSAPPPPPLPNVQQSGQTSTQPSQGNTEQEVPQNQELHIVLRRALARNADTTQPPTDEPDRSQEERTDRASRETQTRHEQQQSTEVQTTLDRPSRPDQSSPERNSSDSRTNDNQSGQGARGQRSRGKDSSSDNRQSSQNRESFMEGMDGPRFQSEAYMPTFHNNQSSQRPYSGIEYDGRPKRSSRIIEQIVITRELDPVTGQPLDSVPMQTYEQRPPRPRSGHNIVYNNSVRDSGRRSRGWAPFSESHRNWSPQDEHVDLTGIVAGMETGTDEEEQYSYMPRESAEQRGRTNQAYDVSPPEERRRPNVVRVSSGQAWDAGHRVPPPPPYTERDASPPPHLRSSMSVERSAGHGWGRPKRSRSWAAADSDGSSTIAAGWTQRTRVVFAVMLLLCIILLLGLVVVVSLYFTAGPGKDCLSSNVCESPSIGYIAAFGVIGFLALIFMLIGVILCCFACRLSRERRMQNYPVSAHR